MAKASNVKMRKKKRKKRKGKREEEKRTLLSQEQPEPPPQRDAMARPLVVGGEARRVRRLGHLAVEDFLEGVSPACGCGVGVGVGEVH